MAEPWPHLIIDNFLTDFDIETLWNDIYCKNYEFDVDPRGEGRIEYAVCDSVSGWDAMTSTGVRKSLERAFSLRLAMNKDNLLQVRRMTPETPAFPVHSDFIENMDYVVSFLYLSPSWKPDKGGQLVLQSSEAGVDAKMIEPLRNRFVAFRSERSHLHEVRQVKDWNRLALLAAWNVSQATHA